VTASIIVPTAGRPGYLDVTLGSIVPQAAEHGAEVLVVDDGTDPSTREAAERHGARYVRNERGRGLNRARNTGLAAAVGDLLVLVDDDIEAQPGWLAALLAAPEDAGVLAGRILVRLEGSAPRSCGREGPPITFLDLGDQDVDATHAYGACMAIRRSALEEHGGFDEAWSTGAGDEEEWVRRFVARGGRVRYVAGAVVMHRRAGDDARLRSLARAAYGRGRTARRYDVARREPKGAAGEAVVLAGCLVHAARFRCTNMLVPAATAAGRLREALSPAPAPPPPEDFLAGRSGTVGGRRGALRRVADRALDALDVASGRRRRLRRAGRRVTARKVLAIGAYRTPMDEVARAFVASRHDVTVDVRPAGNAGKFENLNAILADHDLSEFDWVIVVDDDVVLPHGFLDGFVLLAEHFGLVLAQPAQSLASHAAWRVSRRQPGAVARETTFVEIGPVTAFHRTALEALLPFPELRMAWGLDLHWAAVAQERGWRVGIVDALPVRHEAGKVAGTYPREEAIAEARAFLAERPYLTRDQVGTVAVHRRW
jgi:GT2 family glycosyltransferase